MPSPRHPPQQEDAADAFANRLWEQVALDDARSMSRLLLGETEETPPDSLAFCLADAACCAVEHGSAACLEWLGKHMVRLDGELPQGGTLLHIWAANDGVMADVESSMAVLDLLLEAGVAPCQNGLRSRRTQLLAAEAGPGQPYGAEWTPWLMSSADHRPDALRRMQPFVHRTPSTVPLVPPVLGSHVPSHLMGKLEDYTRHWNSQHHTDPVVDDACLTMLRYRPATAATLENRAAVFLEVFEILRPAPGAATAAFTKRWFEDALTQTSWMRGPAWSILLGPEFRQHLPPDAVDRIAATFPHTFTDRPAMWTPATRAGLTPADGRKVYGCLLAACLDRIVEHGVDVLAPTMPRTELSAIAAWLRPQGWADTASACGMPAEFGAWLDWAAAQRQAPEFRTRVKALKRALALAAPADKPARPRLRA